MYLRFLFESNISFYLIEKYFVRGELLIYSPNKSFGILSVTFWLFITDGTVFFIEVIN